MQQRVVKRFLWFPLTLKGIRKWFCRASICQEMVSWWDDGFLNYFWQDREFV